MKPAKVSFLLNRASPQGRTNYERLRQKILDHAHAANICRNFNSESGVWFHRARYSLLVKGHAGKEVQLTLASFQTNPSGSAQAHSAEILLSGRIGAGFRALGRIGFNIKRGRVADLEIFHYIRPGKQDSLRANPQFKVFRPKN